MSQRLLLEGMWGVHLSPKHTEWHLPVGGSYWTVVLPGLGYPLVTASPGASSGTHSLLGLLHDGAHSRDDGGLGATGTSGDSDHCWQGGCGGEDGGLCYCRHGDGRVPLALPLLGI